MKEVTWPAGRSLVSKTRLAGFDSPARCEGRKVLPCTERDEEKESEFLAQNAEVEAHLDEHGVEWEYHAKFKVSEIDIAASHTNQARVSKPVDEDQVLVYALAMEKGDEFPPVVVHRKSKGGKAIVINGNHRVAAAKMLDKKVIEAYEVTEATEMQILLLTFTANDKQGLALTMHDRVRHAIALVAYGASQKEAADQMGIKVTVLSKELKKAEAYNRLVALGVKRLEKLPGTSVARLGAITQNPVLKSAAEAVIKTGMSVIDVDAMVVEIRKERSEEDQMMIIKERIQDWDDEQKAVGGPKSPVKVPPIVSNIKRVTNTVEKFDKADLKAIPRDLRADLAVRTASAATKLAAMSSSLKPSNRRS